MRNPKVYFLIALILIVFAASSEGQAEEAVYVNYSALSASSLGIWGSYERGFFNKYNLDVRLIYIGSAAKATSAIISGDTPIGQVAGTGPILAGLAGWETLIIATLINTIPQSLMTRKEIQSIADIRGKILGITRFGSLTDFALRLYLRNNGLNPDTDVKLIQFGGIPEILAALRAGGIDGGPLAPPALTQAKKLGFREFADFGTMGLYYPTGCIVVTKTFLRERRRTVLNFLRALIEGIAYVKRNREFSINVLKKHLRVEDLPVLQESYEIYARKYLQSIPQPTEREIRTVLDQYKVKDPRAGTADPGSFLDKSLWDQLRKEGFLEKFER